jgi:hypothetical protein
MAAVNGAMTQVTTITTETRARVHARHAAACAPSGLAHVPSMAMERGVPQVSLIPMGHVWTNAIADAKNLKGFGYGVRRSEELST